jgi:hypothetical protein
MVWESVKPIPILDLLCNEHTSLWVSGVNRDVIRKLLDSIFNTLLVFTLRWKIRTTLHSAFLVEVWPHETSTLVHKADGVYLEERQTKIYVVTLIKLFQRRSSTHLNIDDDKVIISNPSERYQTDITISGTTRVSWPNLTPMFLYMPIKNCISLGRRLNEIIIHKYCGLSTPGIDQRLHAYNTPLLLWQHHLE